MCKEYWGLRVLIRILFFDFSPQLYAKYPNRPMLLEVNNTAPMTVNCTPQIATGTVPGTVKVLVQQADNSTVEAFTLGAVSDGMDYA